MDKTTPNAIQSVTQAARQRLEHAYGEQLEGTFVIAPELADIWDADETIGWVYQYWNSKEERKAMRDASAAPRNSRELAVRNQFFTPRYVVEFLTDNTLGHIWYEMTKGETRLAEQCRYLVRRPNEIFLREGEQAPAPVEQGDEHLSQKELLRQPVSIPHRPLKDPREIRLLDFACGSMHFGLYAFDLFEIVYQEAWDRGDCPALREDFESKDAFLREVPRLIIEHNIHGVDIDPRAVQIAALSLWLRAQKSWRDLPPGECPEIRRTNIVCAEPKPGDRALLEDFVQHLDPPLLSELVKTVFDKMQLAGEVGTLLKIEEEIRIAIEAARQEAEQQRGDLFGQIEAADADFFATAEVRIYAALQAYAESAEAGDYRRRLFAEDAARGFAFIDLCRKRYDAVVMNPPFGEEPSGTTSYINRAYPNGKGDLYSVFVDRGVELLYSNTRLGIISSRTGFFAPLRQKWREKTLLSVARKLPKSGILYNVSSEVLESYLSGKVFGNVFGETKNGFGTLDDFRFLRASFEIPSQAVNIIWFPASKGAVTIPFYGDNIAFFKWTANGKEVKEFVSKKVGSASRKIQSERHYFTPGLTWGRRTSGPQWFSVLPKGCAFTDNGPIALVPLNKAVQALGVCSSSQFRAGLRARSSRGGKGSSASKVIETGHVASCPVPAFYSGKEVEALNINCSSAIAAAMLMNSYKLESSLSLSPPLYGNINGSFADFLNGAKIKIEQLIFTINDALEAIDASITGLGGLAEEIDEEDCCRLGAALIVPSVLELTHAVQNYFVGCLFGRWDIRYATGERQPPELPDPFDPLPVCPPGMLQNADGLPAAPEDVPDNYPLRITWSGILIDDPGHPEDIVTRVREALTVIWGERAAAIEQEACEILGIKQLRDYFAEKKAGSPFFKDHLSRYSKSRRQAPIYWPLSTASGTYTFWVYYHRFDPNTVYSLLRLAGDKLDFEEPKLTKLTQEAGPNPTAKQRKALDAQDNFVSELRGFITELNRIAPLWKPDLNDGVIINAAPVWRLLRNSSWQKKVKDCWDKLVKGDYDWAHLALHLWPERVVPKCQHDRSLAIAHGLKDAFWIEDDNHKWQPRPISREQIDALIAAPAPSRPRFKTCSTPPQRAAQPGATGDDSRSGAVKTPVQRGHAHVPAQL